MLLLITDNDSYGHGQRQLTIDGDARLHGWRDGQPDKQLARSAAAVCAWSSSKVSVCYSAPFSKLLTTAAAAAVEAGDVDAWAPRLAAPIWRAGLSCLASAIPSACLNEST